MRLSPADAIVQDLLEPACQSLHERSITCGQTAGKVFFEYATFCTAQLEDQHAIADIKRMESLHRSKQEEALRYGNAIKDAERRNDQHIIKRLSKDWERASKLQKMDKSELQRLHNLQQTFLHGAILNFLRCFVACADFDHYVPKFCALWLKHPTQKELNSIIANGIGSVASYKFLPLMHQLYSRLSDEASGFQSNLNDLIRRLLQDHPFHAVHQIFSAMFAVGDPIAVSRSTAAKKLINRVSQIDSSTSDLSVRLTEQFSAYSELAGTPIDKKAQYPPDIPFSSFPTLRKFRSGMLTDLCLPPQV